MRVLIAPQEFKGTLTAHEAALAIEKGIRRFDPTWTCKRMPMADGGPGTLDALVHARGGERRSLRVSDPLLRPVNAEWAILSDGAGVVECAAASGLWRLAAGERDPRRASSYGTGQLIGAAIEAGCPRLIIGLGGSATNDGGAGMAQALGYRLLDPQGRDLPPGGAALAKLARIDASAARSGIKNTLVSAAIDVLNPLCGPDGASAVYGPQKGADAAAVAELDTALSHFANIVQRDLGVDVHDIPGAGAAGGLGAGLVAFLGAELLPGGELVAMAAGFLDHLSRADMVVTGEGRLDGQTSFGKGPAFLAERAHALGKACVCIAGVFGPDYGAAAAMFDDVEIAGKLDAPLPSKDEAARQLSAAATRAASRFPGLRI